jgi:hypothetical protein
MSYRFADSLRAESECSISVGPVLLNIGYFCIANYITCDLISCVLMRVDVEKRGVEVIRVSEPELVTYLVNKANLLHNFS